MSKKYELLFLLKPSIQKETLTNLIKKIEDKIGGKVVKKEHWGKKELAYEIKKNSKADYYLYYVETEYENIVDLKKMIAINKNVLRSMIIRHEKKWPFEYKKTSANLKFIEKKPRKIRSDGNEKTVETKIIKEKKED